MLPVHVSFFALVALLALTLPWTSAVSMNTWITESPEPALPVCLKDARRLRDCLHKSFDNHDLEPPPRHPLRLGRLSAGRAGGTVDVQLAVASFHAAHEKAELELTAHLTRGSIHGPFWIWHDGLWLPILRKDLSMSMNGSHSPINSNGGAARVFLNVHRRPPRRVAGCMLLCAAAWRVDMHLWGEFEWRGGRRHMLVREAKMRAGAPPEPGSTHAQRGFVNVTFWPEQGDDIVGDTMAEYLNENAQHILHRVDADACWALLSLCRQMVERLFERVPFDELVKPMSDDHHQHLT